MKKAIIALALLLSIYVSTVTAWWSVPTDFSGSTHYKLTDDARTLIGSDYPDIIKFGVDISDWTAGSTDDARAHNQNSETLETLNKLLNGGPIRDWWDKAQTQYIDSHNFDSGDWSAYYYIALMMHLIEDQSVPAHAYNIKHGSLGYMDNMEQLASLNYNPNIIGIMTADSPISNYEDSINATLTRTLPDSYWRAYWQYGVTCPGITGYDSVYGGPPDYSPDALLMGYFSCPSDVFPDFWVLAGDSERNLTKNLLGQAVGYTAGALISVSKNLPPLVQDLDITPSADAVPVIDTQFGTHISFDVLENRTQNVKLFITVDSPTGAPIISPEYGTGKTEALSPGSFLSALPWVETFVITWDGKLASGAYATNGEHTLCVRVQDDDGNFSPEITHPFSIHRLVLDSGYVDPPSGDTNTDFYYYVYYNDPNGNSPTTANVYIDGTPHAMTLYGNGGSASDGSYVFGPIKLSTGSHKYFFNFTDGQSGTVYLPYAGTSLGPMVILPPQASYPLTVIKIGNGSGTVTSTNISGINCGNDCQEQYATNTTVTLAAQEDGNSKFLGWSGGACNGTSSICTVTINANQSATATFGEKSSSLWVKTFGGTYIEWSDSILKTFDGGYIIVGSTDSFVQGPNLWLMKFDSSDNIQWQKAYNNIGVGSPTYWAAKGSGDIWQTSDQGYIIATSDLSGPILLKLDMYGQVQWERGSYRNYDISGLHSILQVSDGGYIALTRYGEIVRFDSSGNALWVKRYGTDHDTEFTTLQKTSDGEFIVAGFSYYAATDSYDSVISKINSGGNVAWVVFYGDGRDEEPTTIEQTSDGGYIVAGVTSTEYIDDEDVWVRKLDAAGNMQWQKTFGGNDLDIIFSIRQVDDGGYVLAGRTESFGAGDSDGWIVKLDSSGSISWQKTYGGSGKDVFVSIIENSEKNYIVTGTTWSYGAGNGDVWVLKIDSDGNVGDDCIIVNPSSATSYSRTLIRYSRLFGYGDYGPLDSSVVTASAVLSTNAIQNTICMSSAPSIAVSQTFFDFGHVNVGNAASQVDTVSNLGTAYLNINSVFIGGTDAGEFTEMNNCSSVAPGDSCSIFISFIPTTLGDKSAYLSINSNDPHMLQLDVPLSGISGYLLIIRKPGTGTGTVTSYPAGLNCGANCSAGYSPGTVVTLTTTNPDASSVFAGWSGAACSGTQDCTVTMNADTLVTAQFNLIPPVADFEALYTSGVFPLTVVFADRSTANPTSWTWNFGDGTTSTQQNPTHTYSGLGDYTVTLTVTNALGSSKASTESKNNYITVTNYKTYTLAASASPVNTGTISPSGPVIAIVGSNRTFSITPAVGYHIADVLVDGISIGAVTSCALSNISSDHTIEARFAATPYTVTVSAGVGGSISPAGTLTYYYGNNQTFTINSDTANGYYVADVLVDGKSKGAVTQYQLNNITGNHTITAIFSNASSHVIRASAGPNGIITPSGDTSVDLYTSQTFTISPNDGYHVTDVLIDGVSVGSVATYTFSNVTSDHTISASFSNTYTLTILISGDTGTVTSDIGDINCGTTCTAAYAPGTVVTLTATPDANSAFTGWSGACTGSSKTCTLTINSDANVTAQFRTIPLNLWVKDYYSNNASFDRGDALQKTLDGGYIVAGGTGASGNSGMDLWVFKVDAAGNVQWMKSYGGGNTEYAKSIQQTFDGGYIVAGLTYSFGAGDQDAWILKLDANGSVQWQKTYGGSNSDYILSIQQTSDGGYVAAGVTSSFGSGSEDAWILKLNSSGNILWQKSFGGAGADYAGSAQQTSDGGYIVAGTSTSFGAGSQDGWLLKLDADGNIQWQKTYGGTSQDFIESIQQTDDFGYVVAGTTYSFGNGNSSAWVLKLNSYGDIQWQKTYNLADVNISPYSILSTIDGGYIVAGSTTPVSDSYYSSAWAAKLDSNGNTQWQKRYGTWDETYGNAVAQSTDNSYVLLVTDRAYPVGDALLIKLDANGNSAGDCKIRSSNTLAITNSPQVLIADSTATTVNITASPANSTATAVTANTNMRELCSSVGPIVPAIVVNPLSLNFGSVNIGSSITQTISVSNTGFMPLEISLIELTGVNAGEFVQTNNCSEVSMGSPCQIKVTFLSIAPGLKTATVSISSNDPGTPVLNVPLTAIGGRRLTIQKTGVGRGTVVSDPSGINCGSVCEGGFRSGTTLVLSAIPDTDRMAFTGWSGVRCSETDPLGNCTVTMNSDVTVTAGFTKIYRMDASAGPGGSISPAGAFDVWEGAGQTFTITPDAGNQILDLIVDGVSIAAANNYKFDNVMAPHTISVTFSSDINATTSYRIGNIGGTISPSGARVTVACGTNQTFTMTPFDHSHIQDVQADGVSVGLVSTYTFTNVLIPHTINADFAGDTNTITATAGPGGSISPSGSVAILYGTDNQTFTITPNAGFQVLDVLVDGVSVGQVTTYKFQNVIAPHTIAASFSATITASAGGGGSISPSGNAAVPYGTNQTFTITPSAGFHITGVQVDGVSVGAVSSYTFSNVTINHTISASFATTITATSGPGGSISPAGTVDVISGVTLTFTMTPASGNRVLAVLVDGVSVGAVTSYTFTGITAPHTISITFSSDIYSTTSGGGGNSGGTISPSGHVPVSCGTDQIFTIIPTSPALGHIDDVQVDGVSVGAVSNYTFTNVLVSHTITARFAANTYTITASAGIGGTITPSGLISVTGGTSKSFHISPSTGYQILDVIVDGVSVGARTSYSFANVTADHSIQATFH